MFKDKFGEYSIVTTVFNDQETISSLLKNIENQTYYPKEIIIVDGDRKMANNIFILFVT